MCANYTVQSILDACACEHYVIEFTHYVDNFVCICFAYIVTGVTFMLV